MSQFIPQDSEAVVTFTGGLGAQIFSAAIYHYLVNMGRTVHADLDYFKQPGKVATVGNKGEVSHWNYELEEYGLPLDKFSTKRFEKTWFGRDKHHVIADGPEKMELAIEALRRPDVKAIFPVKPSIVEECRRISGGNDYLCLHIRRGDYVNAASHLVDDRDFVNLAKSLSNCVRVAIVISDSEVPDSIREKLSGLFKHCSFVVGGNLHVAHALIRQARYLVCSNSQFSLSAALLNEAGQQIFVPTKWFGDADAKIQAPINALCRFQVLSVN